VNPTLNQGVNNYYFEKIYGIAYGIWRTLPVMLQQTAVAWIELCSRVESHFDVKREG